MCAQGVWGGCAGWEKGGLKHVQGKRPCYCPMACLCNEWAGDRDGSVARLCGVLESATDTKWGGERGKRATGMMLCACGSEIQAARYCSIKMLRGVQ
eukprot:697266-Rhodomonas_salina.2